MSEQPQSIQPPDQPLDPHTLELAIDKLSDRIIDAADERDAEAVREARSDLIALLAFVTAPPQPPTTPTPTCPASTCWPSSSPATNPRARVVVLPEPDEISADGTQAAWKRRGWGGYYVMADSKLCQLSQAGHAAPECARARALAILAAAEFAGGAQ